MFKLAFITAIFLLTGCMNGPTFMSQSNLSNQKEGAKGDEVAAKVLEEIEGVIAAEFSASSASSQYLSASTDSTISGAKISIQPNSLAINTTIKVEEGGSLASGSMLQQMSGSSSLGVTATTNTVMVMPVTPTDLAQPMTVLISIPDSSGLLQSDNPALIVIYKIFKKSEDKWFYGFITRDKLKIVGSFVEFPSQYFGAFQAVILNTEVKEPAKEIVSESSAMSKKVEMALPQVVWGEYKLAFEGSDRSISISLAATGHQELESCELYGDSDEIAPYDVREKIEKFSAKAKINFNRAASLAFSVSCLEKNGRVSQSPWSQKLSIPERVIVSDNIAPTITLSATQSSPTNASTINMTAQFSEAVSGFDIADIIVTNGSKGSFVAVDGDTYTFNITSPSGTVTVNVAGGVAKDSATNNNTAATPFSIIYDNTAPTVTVSAAQTSPTNAATISMTVQFSESVSGFSLDDITVGNGTKGTFTAVDGDTYTFSITSPSGTVTVDVPAGVAQDLATNSNTAANQYSIIYDGDAPTVALSAIQTSPTNAATINMTAQFSEAVTSFTIADITVANGTKGNFVAVDSDTYTFDITSPSGTVTVDIAGAVAQDTASNGNTAATQFSIIYDGSAPTVALSSTQTSPTNATTINMTAQFSEPVTGFTIADIEVLNGTKSNFVAVDGDTYTFDITSPSGTITVDITAGVAQDTTANGNLAATQFSIVYDSVAPAVNFSANKTSPTNATTISVTAQFSESVTGFDITDITVANATKGNFVAVDSDTYTFDLTSPSGTVTVDVGAAVTQDAATNGNTAAGQLSIIYDGSIPTVALSAIQSSPTNASTINMTAQFSEIVTGFTIADIAVTNGTKSNFVVVDGDTYTFDIISPSGTVTADISDSVAQDAAGNNNAAATQFSITHDNTAPTITLSSTQSTPVTASTINMTVQFNESVTGFALSDIVVTNGTGGNFVGVDSDTYTFDITSPSGTLTVNISSSVADDSAGNGNSAATYSLTMANPPNLTGQTAQTFTSTVAISPISFLNTGDPATACSASPALPAGLSVIVDNLTCQITGTPTTSAINETYTITATAADSSTDSATIDIQVNAASPPVLVNYGTYSASTGSVVSINFANTGFSTNNCTADKNLPAGLNLSSNGSTCQISGTLFGFTPPTTYTVTGTASDSSSDTATIEIVATAPGNLSRKSPQRTIVFDEQNNLHWLFYKNGSIIQIAYSTDKTNWTLSSTIAADTPDFTVIARNGDLFLAYGINYDIIVERGTVTISTVPTISWNSYLTVFDGSGSQEYLKPALTISNNLLYVGAVKKTVGTNVFEPKVAESDGFFNTFTSIDLPYKTFEAAVDMALAPYSAGILAVINGTRNELKSFYYNGSFWEEKLGTVSDWWSVPGGINGTVRALAIMNGDLYVGGQFSQINGTTFNSIAKWNGQSWTQLGSGLNGNVLAMTVKNNVLYVGGNFTEASGLPANGIASWNGSVWSALGNGINGSVYALASDSDNIYAGGVFTTMDGSVTANNVARWNLTSSSWFQMQSGLNGYVFALATIGSDLYVGGDFTALGDTTAIGSYIVKWSSGSWVALGAAANNVVNALAVNGTYLYVGGDFTDIGGLTGANRIAKLDTTNTTWYPLGTGINNSVKTIKIVGPKVYAGGTFTTAGGNSASNIAAWNGSSWSPLLTGVGSITWAIEHLGTDVFVGGNFTAPGQNLAQFRPSMIDKVTNFSISGSSTETRLAYIRLSDGYPVMRSFNGTWSGPTPIASISSSAGQIQVATATDDSTNWTVIWDDDSQNINRKNSSDGASSIVVAAPNNNTAWCPTHYLSNDEVPFVWQKATFIGHDKIVTPY